MKQTNYKKSFNTLKGLFLTGLVLLSSSLLGQVYDVNGRPLKFSSESGRQFRVSGNSNTSSNAVIIYKNVISINSTPIDCRVTNIDGSDEWDRRYSTDTLFDNMFVPEVKVNGYRNFRFEFGVADLSNTSSANGTGTATLVSFEPVVLENLYLNFYDIDSEGKDKEKDQIKIDANYSKYELFSSSARFDRVRNTLDATFISNNSSDNSESSYSNVINVSHRVRLTFSTISSIQIGLGAEDNEEDHRFFLDFSYGSNATVNSTVDNNPILIDLDLTSSSFNNTVDYSNSNSSVNLTKGSSSNLTTNGSGNTTANLTNLLLKIKTSEILDGVDEKIKIGNANISLNANSSNNSNNLTLNSVSYNYNVSTSSNVRIVTFSKSSFTQSQAESLLDAIQYTNSKSNYTNGTRMFEVNATLDLATDIQSPSVFFIVNLLTPLPVNLISFTGLSKTEGNQLNWTVAQEVDFSHYEVLRSTNGKEFTKVGEVYPENKSTDMKNYSFLDASVNADLSYYKLNLINEDGSSSLSNLVVINRNVVAPVITRLYPNPATTSLLVSLEGVDAEVSTITIQDLSGKIVYSTETSDVATLLNINELNKGMYIVKVANQTGFVSVSRFIKN